MLKYASLTLSRCYNIEKGRGGQNVKIGDWKTHAFNETGLFRGVSQLLLSMIVVYLNYQKKLFYVPHLCCLNIYTCTVQTVYALYLLQSTIFITTYTITLLNDGFGGGMLFVCFFDGCIGGSHGSLPR